ncbi:MAG: ABC transporter substrate-binding protein [Dermatophilaceae bacterium]
MPNRRILTALAVGAAAGLVLTGCSSSDTGGASSSGGTKAGPVKIAFAPGVIGDEFYITMQCGIEKAVKAAGGSVTMQGPQKFDPTLQKPVIDALVASKPDALLVAPTDVSAMQAPLKAAADAGIKVVLVDTTVNDPSFAVSQISSDNTGGGKAAFEAIKKLKPGGGKVLAISVDPGISTTDARVAGFAAAAGADSKFTYLGVQFSHNEPATAAKLVTAALQKDPQIVGIFGTNLFSAEGSATGVKQAGKSESVSIVGFDAGPAQVKQLESGTVQALVAQQPETIGADGVAQALLALKGQPTEKTIQTGFTIITKETLKGEASGAVYKSSC